MGDFSARAGNRHSLNYRQFTTDQGKPGVTIIFHGTKEERSHKLQHKICLQCVFINKKNNERPVFRWFSERPTIQAVPNNYMLYYCIKTKISLYM